MSHEDEKIFVLVGEYDFLTFSFCLVKEVELVDVLRILLTILFSICEEARGIRSITSNDFIER